MNRRALLMSLTVGVAATTTGWRPPDPAAGAAGPLEAVDHPVEYFAAMRRLFADSDNVLGPRTVIEGVERQLVAVSQLRREHRGADRLGLLRVQVEFADLAGWLHQDSGDHRTAQFYLDRALELAHLLDDRESVAFILARKAQLAADGGRAAEAIDIADASMRLVGVRSRFAAIAASYGAHGHALRGDRLGCERRFASAYETLECADADGSNWGQFFDRAYIDVQCAHSLAVLGDHRAAVGIFESTIAALPPGFHRDRGVYLARAGLAHAGAGAPEQAAACGSRALAVARDTRSSRIVTALTELDRATTSARRVAAVGDFHQAFASFRLAA